MNLSLYEVKTIKACIELALEASEDAAPREDINFLKGIRNKVQQLEVDMEKRERMQGKK